MGSVVYIAIAMFTMLFVYVGFVYSGMDRENAADEHGYDVTTPTPDTAKLLSITPQWMLWQTKELIEETRLHKVQSFIIRFYLQKRGDQTAHLVKKTDPQTIRSHWKGTVRADGSVVLNLGTRLYWLMPNGQFHSEDFDRQGFISVIYPDGVIIQVVDEGVMRAWFASFKQNSLALDSKIELTGNEGFRYRGTVYPKIERHEDIFAWADDAGLHLVNIASGVRKTFAFEASPIFAMDDRFAVSGNEVIYLESGKSWRLAIPRIGYIIAIHDGIGYAVRLPRHSNGLMLLAIELTSGQETSLAQFENRNIWPSVTGTVRYNTTPILFAREPNGLLIWSGTKWEVFEWIHTD